MQSCNWRSPVIRHSLWFSCLALVVCCTVPSECWAQTEVTSNELAAPPDAADDISPRRDIRDSLAPAVPPRLVQVEQPLSNRERVGWAIESSVGMKSLGAGVISAAWGVARDSPDEYGPNWRGFGRRYALRLSGVTIGNAIEAGLGGIWGEDPRYERAGKGLVWSRVARAAKWTILSRHPEGGMRPAYARGIGIVSNNFVTNAWRVESDRSVADAFSRSAVGVTSRCVSNLFDEFWPDVRRLVLRR